MAQSIMTDPNGDSLWRYASLRAAVGGGFAKSSRTILPSTGRQRRDDSSVNRRLSASAVSLVRRTRTSVSLTCSMIAVALAKDFGRTSLALASIVRVSVIIGRLSGSVHLSIIIPQPGNRSTGRSQVARQAFLPADGLVAAHPPTFRHQAALKRRRTSGPDLEIRSPWQARAAAMLAATFRKESTELVFDRGNGQEMVPAAPPA